MQGAVHITAAYILLEDKKQATYEEMFRIIMEECQERNIFLNAQNFYVDFEIAVFNAVQETFGDEVTIQGCFYHLCQSTYRKVQELGLVDLYKLDQNFNQFCGMLDGLAFLCEEKVGEGMTHLKEVAPEAAAG